MNVQVNSPNMHHKNVHFDSGSSTAWITVSYQVQFRLFHIMIVPEFFNSWGVKSKLELKALCLIRASMTCNLPNIQGNFHWHNDNYNVDKLPVNKN